MVAEDRARAHELTGLFDRELVEIQRLTALLLGQRVVARRHHAELALHQRLAVVARFRIEQVCGQGCVERVAGEAKPGVRQNHVDPLQIERGLRHAAVGQQRSEQLLQIAERELLRTAHVAMPDRQIHGLAGLPSERHADQRRAQRVRRAGLDRDRKGSRLTQFGRERAEALLGQDQRNLGRADRRNRLALARCSARSTRRGRRRWRRARRQRERRLAARRALGFVRQGLQLTLEAELGVEQLQRGDVAPAVGEVSLIDEDRTIVFQFDELSAEERLVLVFDQLVLQALFLDLVDALIDSVERAEFDQ